MRNYSLAVNIPADGIELALLKDTALEREEYASLARDYVRLYLDGTKVGKMIFNVCYKRSITDSDVFDSVLYNVTSAGKLRCPPSAQTNMLSAFREMIARGIDVIELLITATKEMGAQAWLSVRMNDHHFPDDREFNSTLSYEKAGKLGVNGSRAYLDFTENEVQNYYKAYISELCSRYAADGIELDFLRSAPVMSNVTEENTEKLTAFVYEIAKTVRAKGKDISARVYSTPEQNASFGIDAPTWVANGSVTTLTVSGWYIPTYYSIPVKAWREEIARKNVEKRSYSLLCGTDWAVRCDSRPYEGYAMWMTLEHLRGFASNVYSQGADGVYFFNHFMPDGDEGAITYYLTENGMLEGKNVLKDKLLAAETHEAAEQGECSYVNTCQDYSNTLYPIKLQSGESFSFKINTGRRSGARDYTVIVGTESTDGEAKVEVNGTVAKRISDVAAPQGFCWQKSGSAEPKAKHLSGVAPTVMRFGISDISSVNDGENSVTVSFQGVGAPLIIKWLEVRKNTDR